MFTIFRGGNSGAMAVERGSRRSGAASLAPTPALSVVHSLSITLPIMPSPTSWRLAGVASHLRYTERDEKKRLDAVRAEIGRPEATHAALIPIKKSATWWELTQEERRQIFEDRSHHIAASLKYLPAVARQLYHCPRSRRAVRLPDLVRIRARRRGRVRGTGPHAARHRGMALCRARGDIRMERERLDAGVIDSRHAR
jgi:hypothetical protein